MKLFKEIEEIQQFFKVNGTQKLDSLDGFERDALEKYIRRYVGETLLADLVTWYSAATPTTNAAFTALLPYVQSALIKFTYYLGAPTLDLQITEAGFAVVSSGNVVPASKDRVANFRESIQELAWDAIESLLKFLEKNKADYDDWVASEAYTIQTGLFVNSAEEFNKHVNINDSVLKFLSLRQTIEDVEFLTVYPQISIELAEGIKAEIKDGSISTENAKNLPYIKKAVAQLTAHQSGMGDNFGRTGMHYLMEAKKMIDATPTDYPLYMASSAYVAPANYQKFENTEDSTVFVFGG